MTHLDCYVQIPLLVIVHELPIRFPSRCGSARRIGPTGTPRTSLRIVTEPHMW